MNFSPDQLQVREDWVLIWIPPKSEERYGNLVIPTMRQRFAAAKVLSVGQGVVVAEGGEPNTHDLKPGMIVFVEHKTPQPSRMAPGKVEFKENGLPMTFPNTVGTYLIVNQAAIIGILDLDSDTFGEDDEDTKKVPGIVTLS